MDFQLEQLRRRAATLRYQLEVNAIEMVENATVIGESKFGSLENGRAELRAVFLRAEQSAFEAELVAVYAEIARMEVDAEVYRLCNQAPNATAAELLRHRERLEKVIDDHKQAAEEIIEAAIDDQLACDRSNGDKPRPEVELTEQQRLEQTQKRENTRRMRM